MIGKPASIMVENCRAKRMMSDSRTLGCRNLTFANRSFDLVLMRVGVIFCRARLARTASSLWASISPFWTLFNRFFPTH